MSKRADSLAGASMRSEGRSVARQHDHQAFQEEAGDAMGELTITHVNPESMHANPAFSQAVTVEGNAKTIYIGGQNAVGPDGAIVGEGDLAAQVAQALKNLETVLTATGATRQDVVKWTIFVLQGQDLITGFTAFQEQWGPMEKAPAITSAFVAALANPAFLVEIEAIAVVSAGG
jgi:enamine deaminase RidA (YjgF/YER057c/UK114 family)